MAAASLARCTGAPGRGCSTAMVREVEWMPGIPFLPSPEMGRRRNRPAALNLSSGWSCLLVWHLEREEKELGSGMDVGEDRESVGAFYMT
jgi:hypothetical protein